MRRAAWITVFICLLAHPVWAQEGEEEETKPEEETLISGGIDSGGFGALVFKFSGVNDQFAGFAGARGGWIINHQFVVGAGGYGLTSNICLDEDGSCFLRQIEFGYGGFEFEYIGLWNRVAHYSLQLLIGGGGVTLPLRGFPSDAVFVAEPAARLELNVTKWFRLNLGAGYRFVSGLDLASLENSDLSAFSGVLEFKFGSF
jgi:hypothetical protein